MKTISLPPLLRKLQGVDFPHKLGICERLFGRVLKAHGICWVQTGAGIPWKLDLTNATHRWIVYGKYGGSGFLNWACNYLPPDGVIIDSGANIGQMLMYLAQWVPQGQVLAFEPGKNQATWLEECLALHNALPVKLLRVGLGNSTTQLRLNNTGPDNVHGAWSQISETHGEPVNIVRLVDELSTQAIDKVALWKLDIEGYEIPALSGAEMLLKEHRINALYVELSGENGKRVREFLSNMGYSCYLLDWHGAPYNCSNLPHHVDGLFLPN